MTKQEFIESANYYINTRHWSIFPVARNKRPLVEWKEYQTRFATPEEIEQWSNLSDVQIGAATGSLSNITVIDIENGGSIDGLAQTLIAKTGSGGFHFFYKYKNGIRNKARFRELADVRSEGGYVMVANSYNENGPYSWINNSEIVDLPNGLIPTEEEKLYPINNYSVSDYFNNHNFCKSVEELPVWDGISNGARNETLTRYIGSILPLIHPSDWEILGWEAAKIANANTLDKKPMNEYELRMVFNSIKGREKSKPSFRKNNVNLKPTNISSDIEFLTFSDVLTSGANELHNTKKEDIVSFGYSWLDEKMTGIFKGELIVIGGESGSGKTTFATNIIYKASKDHKCCVFALEDRLNDYGIKALYFEIGRLRFNDRKSNYNWNDYRKNNIQNGEYKKYAQEAYENLKNENVYFANVKNQLDINVLEKLIEDKVNDGVELFLIDHLHYFDLLKGSNSKADYIESLMVRLKILQNRTGARILLIVHYRKLNGQKPNLDSFKDSISIVQNANYVINLWRDRSIGADHYKTLFLIPKSRNPNGEATLETFFDPNTNDYNLNNESFGGSEKGSEENKNETFNKFEKTLL